MRYVVSLDAADLLISAILRKPPDIVPCDECGRDIPYSNIGHHYIRSVYYTTPEYQDFVTLYICRDCA